MSFLSELQDELERVELQDVKGPKAELEDGQEAVGELSEELQRLWVVKVEANNALNALKGELLQLQGRHYGEDKAPPEFAELATRYNLAVHRSEALDNLFWTSVRIEFPILADKGSIGLAEEWQVYWQRPRPNRGSPLAAILGLLAADEDD